MDTAKKSRAISSPKNQSDEPGSSPSRRKTVILTKPTLASTGILRLKSQQRSASPKRKFDRVAFALACVCAVLLWFGWLVAGLRPLQADNWLALLLMASGCMAAALFVIDLLLERGIPKRRNKRKSAT